MKFTSPELQKAFESAKPILEKITETKNRISTEIKNVEKFFQSLDINELISYLATNPNQLCNVNCEQIGEYCATGNGTATEEYLIWDNKKKRLMYVENSYQASIDLDSIIQIDLDTSTLKNIIEKPLIETTFDIRKRIYEDHLSSFISYVAKKFEVIEKPFGLDIPF